MNECLPGNSGPVLLIGGGGHCRSVLAVLLRLGLPVLGIVDPAMEQGEPVYGVPVLGSDAELPGLRKQTGHALVTVGSTGSTAARRRLFQRLSEFGYEFPVVVSDRAFVSRDTEIRAGAVVLDGAVVNCGARIRANAVINTAAVVEHDCRVDAHAFVATGAVLAGGVKVGQGAFLGLGCRIIQGVSVGRGAVVGAGSVVLSDVPDGWTVAGVPARKIRESDGIDVA